MQSSSTPQNVVNFSDLSQQEQQKYIEFILKNKFIFNEDKSADTYDATIKINMNQVQKSQNNLLSSQNTQYEQQTQMSIPLKNKFTQSKVVNDKIKKLKTNSFVKIDGKKNNQNENSENATNRNIKQNNQFNNHKSKSPLKKEYKEILQNITNKHSKQNNREVQNNTPNSSGVNNKQLTAFDAGMQLVKSTHMIEYSNINKFDDPFRQSVVVETKKQQILEKLQSKLNQANQYNEQEENKEQKQKVMKDLENKKLQPSKVIQQEKKVIKNISKNNSSENISRTNRTTRSTSQIISKSNKQLKNKDKQQNQDNNQDENETRSRQISIDLMLKNQEYINKLQDKNKQKQTKLKKKSVSPKITPRKFIQTETNQQDQKRSSSQNRNSSNSPCFKQPLSTRSKNATPENKQIKNNLKASTTQISEKLPSTFEQVMKKQSQVIKRGCNMQQNDKKKNVQAQNINEEKKCVYQSNGNHSYSPKQKMYTLNSGIQQQPSSQRQIISKNKAQNKKTQNITPKKIKVQDKMLKVTQQTPENKQEVNLFEFNSFGSPQNNFEVNQVVCQNTQVNKLEENRNSKIENTQVQKQENNIIQQEYNTYQIKSNSNNMQGQQKYNTQLKQDSNSNINQNQKRKSELQVSPYENDDEDNEFKLYNIKHKRNRKQENQTSSVQSLSSLSNAGVLQSSFHQASNTTQEFGQSGNYQNIISTNRSRISDVSDNCCKIQMSGSMNSRRNEYNPEVNEDQFQLTEIRSLIDQNVNLHQQKLTLTQLYKNIEELYQAKFYQNTLMMKINSNGEQKIQMVEGYKNELNHQLDYQPYDISFNEFIYEYYKEKFINSQSDYEQHLINLIDSVEYYLSNSNKYSYNQTLPIQTFAAFIQNTYQKEELIFFLFAREMLLKFTQDGFDSNNIFETQNIDLTLDECQNVLEQIYGRNEQKIIDRFMDRLADSIMMQKDTNECNINANLFLNLILQDYMEGKTNKIYESYKQNEQYCQNESFQQQQMNDMNQAGMNSEDIDQYKHHQSSRNNQTLNSNNPQCMNSFEKWEYTFEQSFGEASNHPNYIFSGKKYKSFTPQNDLEEIIWEKMIQKIEDFIELVINDNYNEFTIKEKKSKFSSVEKIVTKKVNKMIGALFDQDKELWFNLLCITHPSSNQFDNLQAIMNMLEILQNKPINQICNSEVSHFCKTILQTKELSKAIGKLLVCVLIPDYKH